MSVASLVRVVVPHRLVVAIRSFIWTALSESSLPWSITLTTSSGPTRDRVTCSPPLPHPRATGISRAAKGTWWPGMQSALSTARRTARLDVSSR